MSNPTREQVEQTVRRLATEGDRAGAATATIRGYGPEILGFLMALHRDGQAADEVFALWSERVWRGLEGFDWACSLRTWAYVIARNVSTNYQRDARVRARRDAPMPETTEISRLTQEVRSETRPYQRTDAKDKLAAIRESLPAEDQLLLVLRVDKQLEWKDVARVMLEGDAPADEARLGQEAQRLRKRFQLLKERLVELARQQGMFGGS